MSRKDVIKSIFRAFNLMIVGHVIAVPVFCSIFIPNVIYGLEIFYQILINSALCALLQIMLESKKEPSKKEMLVRQSLHIIALIALLFVLASRWDWVEFDSPAQTFGYFLLILGVYVLVRIFVLLGEKKEVDHLNKNLQKFRQDRS